jgi:[ribosomal protein S5]-alanine N-acetyltransferase
MSNVKFMLAIQFQPFPELHTQRLRLRRLTESDVDVMYAMRSDTAVMQYMDMRKAETYTEAKAKLEEMNADIDNNKGITWCINLLDHNDMIGYVSIWRIDPAHFRGEVGYALSPHFWGKGIASEALEAVVKFGFSQLCLHSLEAIINPNNNGSANVLEKQGFVKEGHFKENYFFDGKFLDSVVYAQLNPISSAKNRNTEVS